MAGKAEFMVVLTENLRYWDSEGNRIWVTTSFDRELASKTFMEALAECHDLVDHFLTVKFVLWKREIITISGREFISRSWEHAHTWHYQK